MIFFHFDKIKEFIHNEFKKKSKRFREIYEKILAKNFDELRLDLGIIAVLWFGLINPLWEKMIEFNYKLKM